MIYLLLMLIGLVLAILILFVCFILLKIGRNVEKAGDCIREIDEVEKLAERLHIWYLEATKELHPESYNPHAQKSYAELTEEQRFIDRYIAGKIYGKLL